MNAVEAAETTLIAGLMSDARLHHEVDDLKPECFSSRRRYQVYRATLDWCRDGGGSGLLIPEALAREHGGSGWLDEFIEVCSSASSSHTIAGGVVEAAEVLRSFASRRAGMDHIIQAASAAHGGDMEEASRLASLAAAEFRGASEPGNGRASAIGDASQEVLARIVEMRPNIGPEVGLDYFDRGYGCAVFAPGKLVVLAARPGVGKTALALQLAIALAERFGVGYWSCEMDAEELASRAIVSLSGVRLARIISGRCDSRDLAGVKRAVGELVDTSILFDDSATATVNSIAALSRLTAKKYGSCGAVIVDYFQSMSSLEKHTTLHASLGEVSRGLKAFARASKLAVIVPTQLNRKIEDREDGQFRMSDLGECGRLEQDADTIFYLDRPFARNRSARPSDATIYSAKVRGGVAGVTGKLRFDGELQRFTDG